MSLAQRLLLALGVLTLAVTVALALGVREAWRRAEEDRFREQFLSALSQLERGLSAELERLPRVLEPLCRHDPSVDSALVGVSSGDLANRQLSLSVRVPELGRALDLDRLFLVAHDGRIIGATEPGLVGTRNRALSSRLEAIAGNATLRREAEPPTLEVACLRRDSEDDRVWVALYAERNLDALLEQAALAHGLTLSLEGLPRDSSRMVESIRLSALSGVEITAARSRVPLLQALRRLDWTIFALGGGILAVALVVALVVSRGLARPIAELAEQTRKAAGDEPTAVSVRGGGRELEQLAQAFNTAMSDLRDLSKRLAASERETGRREIAERVAHEIKNPLAPIRAAVETLRRLRARNDPAFDDYFDEATRTALDEVRRINDIVTEFTRFARLPRPNPRPFELTEVAASVVSLHAVEGIKVRLDAPAELELRADRDQIVQVLTNLLQNAIDASRSAERPEVVVTLAAEQGRVRLSVADNGPGVAPEVGERLFEPYVTTKPNGTGLGLAIVERIVIEHGGLIRYEDVEDGGARFVVELPRWPEAHP